ILNSLMVQGNDERTAESGHSQRSEPQPNRQQRGENKPYEMWLYAFHSNSFYASAPIHAAEAQGHPRSCANPLNSVYATRFEYFPKYIILGSSRPILRSYLSAVSGGFCLRLARDAQTSPRNRVQALSRNCLLAVLTPTVKVPLQS